MNNQTANYLYTIILKIKELSSDTSIGVYVEFDKNATRFTCVTRHTSYWTIINELIK